MSKLSTDDRVGPIQLRVAEKARRQRGGGMTVRVEDMRYLLDRIVTLEAQLRDALPFLAHVQCATIGEGDALTELEGRIATAVGAGRTNDA